MFAIAYQLTRKPVAGEFCFSRTFRCRYGVCDPSRKSYTFCLRVLNNSFAAVVRPHLALAARVQHTHVTASHDSRRRPLAPATVERMHAASRSRLPLYHSWKHQHLSAMSANLGTRKNWDIWIATIRIKWTVSNTLYGITTKPLKKVQSIGVISSHP